MITSITLARPRRSRLDERAQHEPVLRLTHRLSPRPPAPPGADSDSDGSSVYRRYESRYESRHDESGDGDDEPKVYVHGSCLDNGRPEAAAGVGVFWGDGDFRNRQKRLKGVQTNNRAALMAVIVAIDMAKGYQYEQITIATNRYASGACWHRLAPWFPVGESSTLPPIHNRPSRLNRTRLIRSFFYRPSPPCAVHRSQLVIDIACKYLPRWQQNGFRRANGQPVKNRELAAQLAGSLAHQRIRVQFEKVSKWSNCPFTVHGHQMACRLARKGAQLDY